MNYIKLINQFWKLRRSKRITSLQADLYFFLIQECNEQDWENPFECSNKLICANIGISEPSLIDARNRLKQLNLIDFVGGKRSEKSPVYTILYLNNLSRNRTGSLVEPLVETEEKGEHIYNKPNQTKLNKTSKSHCGDEPPQVAQKGNDSSTKQKKEKEKKVAPKKEKGVTPHWDALVDTWFKFYETKYLLKPSFDGVSREHFRSILKRLKAISEEKGYEWDEKYAVRCLNHFLVKGHEKEWLRNNFLLSNLSKQFDVIVNPNNHGNPKTNGQSVGASVSTASAFAKIDAMLGQTGS